MSVVTVLQEIMQTLSVCVSIIRVIVGVLSELLTSNRDMSKIRNPVLQISGGRASTATETVSAKVLWWE